MKNYKKETKKLKILSKKKHYIKRIPVIAVLMIAAITIAAFDQTPANNTVRGDKSERQQNADQQSNGIFQKVTPLVDHHTHIWSENASSLILEPLMPVIELPDELKRLLQDKEKFGGRDKNPSALTDLYTKDLLLLNPSAPAWLRGERALSYVINSTVISRLLPTAYDVEGSAGYIAGYEAEIKGESTNYLSNFLYVIKKGSDGKWRISSEVFTVNPPAAPKALSVERLIQEMDDAGVKKAAVLSVAYWFGRPIWKIENEYEKVKAENDWLAEQVSKYPDRLVAFCSFNPLKDYALEELNRCTKNPKFKGLKLHIGNSRVDVLNPEHMEKLRAVFRAANEKRFPILAHLRASGGGSNYLRPHGEAFLNQVLPVAPDIPIVIAHMAATGPGYEHDDVFEVYANAASKNDPRMKNVYVDIAAAAIENTPPETLELIAKRLRQFGLQRVLFASDSTGTRDFGNESPKDAWKSFRRLPMTEKEFKIVAENVAPYMR